MDSTATLPGQRAFLLRPRVLDRIEQAVILLMWAVFAWRMVHTPNAYGPAIMVSETAVMLFTLIRRPTATISLRLGDWLLATTATIAPLLIIPDRQFRIRPWSELGLFLLLFGNSWQAWAKLILRRSFGLTPANRGVKITGAYRFMRHPMYAGIPNGTPRRADGDVLALQRWRSTPSAGPRRSSGCWPRSASSGEDPAYREYMDQGALAVYPGRILSASRPARQSPWS